MPASRIARSTKWRCISPKRGVASPFRQTGFAQLVMPFEPTSPGRTPSARRASWCWRAFTPRILSRNRGKSATAGSQGSMPARITRFRNSSGDVRPRSGVADRFHLDLQGLGVERLDDIVVHAGLLGGDDVLGLGFGR